MWEGVGRPNKDCNILTPNSSGYHSLSSPFSWAAQPGPGGLASALTWFPFQHLLSNWSKLPVTGVIIWHPPTSFERHNSHSIQPLDSQGRPLISSTGYTCYLHRSISLLTVWPGQSSICNIWMVLAMRGIWLYSSFFLGMLLPEFVQ